MTHAIHTIRNFLSSHHIGTKKRSKSRDATIMNGNNNSNGSSSSSRPSNGNSNGSRSREPVDANALLPRYLFPLVRHYHDDFYISRSFDPRLLVQLMSEGFLPIATKGYLLPKLHVERCVLGLNPECKLHVSKSTRKKSKRFELSVNECFDKVVAGCHRQHGTNWLYPPIVNAFRAIHQRTKDENAGGVNAMIMNNMSQVPQDVTPVRLYSVEVWNAETGTLAGGELGYSVGGIYSSLTGFSDEDAAGSSQLVALGKLLTKCGFEYWDLGMDLEYKRRLGAEMIQRVEFVSQVKRSRVENKGVVLQCGGVRRNAKELIDWDRMDTTTNENGNTAANGNGAKQNKTQAMKKKNGKQSKKNGKRPTNESEKEGTPETKIRKIPPEAELDTNIPPEEDSDTKMPHQETGNGGHEKATSGQELMHDVIEETGNGGQEKMSSGQESMHDVIEETGDGGHEITSGQESMHDV